MLRTTVKSDLQQAAETAVRLARNNIAGIAGAAGASSFAMPPTGSAEQGVDGEGNLITIHNFMIGVDAIGDTSAVIRSGPPILTFNYGF